MEGPTQTTARSEGANKNAVGPGFLGVVQGFWVKEGSVMNGNMNFSCPIDSPPVAKRECSKEDEAKDGQIKLAYRDFKAKLKALADAIDERNAKEPERNFNGFNPRSVTARKRDIDSEE